MKRLLRHTYQTFILTFFLATNIQANSIEPSTPLKLERYIYPISIQLQNIHMFVWDGFYNFPVWIPSISTDILCMNNAILEKLGTYPRFGLNTYFSGKHQIRQDKQRITQNPFWAISTYMELDKFYTRAESKTHLNFIEHFYPNNFGNKLSIGCLSYNNGYSLIFTQELLWFIRFNPNWENIFSIGLTVNTFKPKTFTTEEPEDLEKIKNKEKITAEKYFYFSQSIRFTFNKKAYLDHIGQLMLHKKYQCLKRSRVDTSLMINYKYHKHHEIKKKYNFPVMIRALYSVPLEYYTGWICSLELGYGMQKKLSYNYQNTEYTDALSINFLTGIEFRYNNLLLQYQIGLPSYDYLHDELKIILSTDLQIQLSKRFFISANFRDSELPGFRIGVSL